jgi:O-antigen ligase
MTAEVMRPRRDFAVLGAVVLAQAGVLVWLGDAFGGMGRAAAVSAGLGICYFAVPPVFTYALTAIRRVARAFCWWHWLWLFLFCSDFVFRFRDSQSLRDEPLDFWALYRVALVGLAGAVLLWRLITRRGEWLESMSSGLILAMALFPLAGLLSTVWSVYPAWTAYKSLELLVDIAVLAATIAAIRSVSGLKSLFDWNWLMLAGLQVTVWLGLLIAPEHALLQLKGAVRVQLTGVLPSIAANGVGHIGALLAVVALARMLDRNSSRARTLVYSLVFASSFLTLFYAQTRSALMAFAAGAVLVLLLSRRPGVVAVVAIATVILLSATALESSFLEYFRRGQSEELLLSFSGRTNWWSFAWDRFLERPFTGYGGFAGGRFAALAEMGDQSTSSVHNTYLEAVLGIGIFGLVPLAICLFGVWWRFLKSLFARVAGEDRPLILEAVGVLTVITVRSAFTTDLIWHPALPWFLVLGCAELLGNRRYKDGL